MMIRQTSNIQMLCKLFFRDKKCHKNTKLLNQLIFVKKDIFTLVSILYAVINTERGRS